MIDINKIFNQLEKQQYAALFFTPPIYKNSKSYLFYKPNKIFKITNDNYSKQLKEIDKTISKKAIGYAVIDYEAGFLFENKLTKFLSGKNVLGEFVFFDKNNFEQLNSENISFDFGGHFKVKNFRLNTSEQDYYNAIKKIKSYIESGDTYQVNYTAKGKFNFSGELCSLFQNLIFNQSAQYIAVIHLSDKFIISISPELFFEVKNNKISTRPMKGTSQRYFNIQQDLLAKYDLLNSEKNKAENVMIVDLLRNDIGKISQFGSVKVDKLFQVEKYESLFQMTSEINSRLKKGISFSDIIKNIFPCGSVTGAPKIRTMEIIQEIEKEKRGIYTGSVGVFLKDKKTFNVAIRTLVFDKKNQKGEIGLGSGIVWDSEPAKEYSEVLLKSKFLTEPQSYFELFETILVKNNQFVFLEPHIERLKISADYFLFRLDLKYLNKIIKAFLKNLDSQKFYKVKIILSKYGRISIKKFDLPPLPDKIKVILSPSRINSQNKFQFFKTTNRRLYNDEHKKYCSYGFFDVIYLNEKNELAEGAITNIFVKKDGLTFTPPLSSGILAGVYRSIMLKKNSEIKEKKISLDDLIKADEIILTNSLRGEIKVDELYLNQREYISYKKNNL